MSLYQLPLNRVIERRLCREYYASTDPRVIGPDGSVSEDLCKIDAVQTSLGWIQGVMDTIWIGGDFIMTIPLSFLAEKWGRRMVLRLNLASRVFMLSWAVIVGFFDQLLPTKAIIVGPTLSVLGGDCVFNSITYALASDLTDDHVLRAIYFGYMSSVSYVVALLGPALASATMTALLWLPFWLGIFLLLLAVPTIHKLPQSPQFSESESVPDEEQRQPLLSSPLLKAQDTQPSLLHSTIQRFRILHTIVTSHPRNFSLLLFSFFLTSLASSDTKLLVQYISKRYSWTFASAGYLLSGKAVVNFTLLTVVIPRFLQSRRVSRGSVSMVESADSAHVRYANACLVVSVIGALGIAVAAEIWMLIPSLALYALGSALPIFTLSLLKSPAVSPPHGKDHDDATNPDTHIFSIVMLVKTVGSLLGAPTMAALWVRGIGIGGLALGMPYFISSACYGVALGVFSCIQVE
ncbi:major facilitator superfamily domain-containing protein [Dactylonectria macrodidyma]|uniref:Major facilitator superfamily domain-containing protein n=1 Tax=Dactylonectria macrodidyma TaxID=307937 RepID=A0A9P9F4U0_9HYPO|nr:major facilitator superfamily domain-containing protein [Dactylonectria macrodidyma]